MKSITISNDSFNDKNYFETFAKQDKYKFFNVNDGTSTLVSEYENLLKEVLSDVLDTLVDDYELVKENTLEILQVFDREIIEKLANWKPTGNLPHKDIEYNGKTYALDLRLTNPRDRQINDYFLIINICKECISENKSMYLTIE